MKKTPVTETKRRPGRPRKTQAVQDLIDSVEAIEAAPAIETFEPIEAAPAAEPVEATETKAPPKVFKHIQGPSVSKSLFSKFDVQALELWQLRASSAQQAVDLRKLAVERLAREMQEKLKEEQKNIERLEDQFQKRGQELLELYAEIEEAYGVSMRDITYDPKSGRIMRAPPGLLDRA